jgi:hypothetical protein
VDNLSVLSLPHLQREVVQGPPQDGIGIIGERLEWRHVAAPADKHGWGVR